MFSVKVKHKGADTSKYLDKLKKKEYFKVLELCGEDGVKALQEATPKDTGETANSWTYEIVADRSKILIYWKNSKLTKDGDPVAILLQYGHTTGNGGYVQGLDYINPAIKPVFDNISDRVWKAMVAL